MPHDHPCPDCGRKFTSGAALGGHRRVHTKGRLSKGKNGTKNRNRRPRPTSTLPSLNPPMHKQPTRIVHTSFNTQTNPFHTANRALPEPHSTGDGRVYGLYVTDLSSSDESTDYSHTPSPDSDKYWSHNQVSAMPPPIKKRKLNANNPNFGPVNIGFAVQTPNNLCKPTKMDAIREQIGLAMTLYHFNVSELAQYCDIPKPIFIKWLQGGIEQKPNIGVNGHGSHNKNHKNNKNPQKRHKTPIFKIKFKRSQLQNRHKKSEKSETKGYYLTPILADQIAEKMQRWLDNFIRNGFMNKNYLRFVHHYKRYKNGKSEANAHSFDNLDMKWDKIKTEKGMKTNASAKRGTFDWNDDSSFYYNAQPKVSENQSFLIPIEINEIVKGKPFSDSFLWNPSNSEADLREFINTFVNDLREFDNEELKRSVFGSAQKQIFSANKVRNEYSNALHSFGSKNAERAYNYLQHLHKPKGSETHLHNLMHSITDVCHGNVLIKLKITHGKVKLIDEFLWNINDSGNDSDCVIEQFANVLCADQGLPFVFVSSIALEIRKQINARKLKMTKCMKANNAKKLNAWCDPLSYESLRFVGRDKEKGLRDLKLWQPRLLVHKPPNTMKTKVRQ